ncbi:MAG: hypothetical protein K1X88_12645 [Nannocystaceae bacterium]|nr:hypothetical protein [Nannocystaceae bacterium]
MKRLSFLVTAALLSLTGACEQQSTTDSMEASASKLAEMVDVADYTIEVVPPPADSTQPPLPTDDPADADALSTEQPDPEELRVACYEWQDGSGCSTCVVNWGNCAFWSSACMGDQIWSNC